MECDTAGDGEQAFKRVKKKFEKSRSTYKLIVMDLIMPKIDGFGALKKIVEFLHLEARWLPKPYIVALTSITGEQTKQKCLEAGFD